MTYFFFRNLFHVEQIILNISNLLFFNCLYTHISYFLVCKSLMTFIPLIMFHVEHIRETFHQKNIIKIIYK